MGEADAKMWEQGLADAVRLGAAKRDEDTLFCGFFWKLNNELCQGGDIKLVPGKFEFEHWRIRLFVLKSDGRLVVYSHKEHDEIEFLNVTDVTFNLEWLASSWRGLQNL